MNNPILSLFDRIASIGCHVTLDPHDNSVTLSRALFRHIRRRTHDGTEPKVFTCLIETAPHVYAFTINPPIQEDTVLATIQYNSKYKCIGFETLCPSVGTIFYHYGLPAKGARRLRVSIHRTTFGIYYRIHRPTTT